MLNKTIKFIRDRVRNHLIFLSIFHLLEKFGIKLVLYYLTLESLDNKETSHPVPELNPITYNFLSAAELADLFSQPGMKYFKKEAVKRQAKGCLCFALKHHHDCAAYMWCNLRECNSDLVPFPLNSGEAYLLGARTMDAYRGKNLAPFIRYELYKKLVKMGYTRFYSTTEYFNASAVNFKRKLKARHIKLCLYFGLFNKPIFNLALRKYSLTYK